MIPKPKITAEIRIFDMDGGITWVAGATVVEAVEAFAESMGYDKTKGGVNGFDKFLEDYPDTWEDVKELKPEDYDRLIFLEDTEGEPKTCTVCKQSIEPEDFTTAICPEGKYRRSLHILPDDKKTFRQKLNELIASGETFPAFFATSEY